MPPNAAFPASVIGHLTSHGITRIGRLTADSASAYRMVLTRGASRTAARAPRLEHDNTHQPPATNLLAKYIPGRTWDSGTGAIRLRVPAADVPGFT
ncbi:hypothetical protein SAMN06265360_101118 [Haloechinothrix alba]|uniref:Uncharacterized protein n=1 Tax=Haloechinothrix alba TaxID=664784 RepID=A0A238V2M8_9PSEU|nr:hypothetical protein [Haloechinothrix alba]SNR27779.1 hypothetical protein SAMN06265360_101118 [Haloechinothrix alba]